MAAAIALASTACSQSSHWKLELSPSASTSGEGQSAKMDIQAGETTMVELLVIGAAPGPLTFAAADLPAFATLRGPVLKVAPGRTDAGEYDVTVTATAGGESRTATIHLVVHRFNSAPTWPRIIRFTDNHGYRDLYCPGPFCTADGPPNLSLAPCDAEGDGMTVDVEVVSRGQPFRRVPTHSATVPSMPPRTTNGCRAVELVLTGLAVDQSYDFGIRISDEFGATSNEYGGSGGWEYSEGWRFDQGPCAPGKCACFAPGAQAFCNGRDYVCCSGSCFWDGSPSFPRCL
jgi:hypothetical protein